MKLGMRAQERMIYRMNARTIKSHGAKQLLAVWKAPSMYATFNKQPPQAMWVADKGESAKWVLISVPPRCGCEIVSPLTCYTAHPHEEP